MAPGVFAFPRWLCVLAVLSLSLALAACGLPGGSSPPSQATAAPSRTPTGAASADTASAGSAAAVLTAATLDRPLRFEQVSIEQGLSESVVRAILQDRQGFLWFGTDDGLNRFDGYDFVTYQSDPALAGSLSDNQVRSLFEDSQGRLWVGTYNGGLNRYQAETGTFIHYHFDEKRPESLSANRVNAILEDHAGNLWVATNNGLNRYDPKLDGFWRYQNQPDDPNSLGYNAVFGLAEDSQGSLWIGTGKSLDRYDPLSGHFSHFRKDSANAKSLSGDTAYTLVIDHLDRLWIGTMNPGGIDRFDPQSGQFIHYPVENARLNSTGGLDVKALYEDQAHVMWAGLLAGGLCRLLPGQLSFHCVQHDSSDPNSLSADDVLALFEDRSGILWAGTFGGGANQVNPGYKRFSHYHHDPQYLNSLADNMVFALLEDQQGRLWVGMDGHGLDRVDRAAGKVTHFRHDPNDPGSLSSDDVKAIYEDHTGTLWVGTASGLNRLDPGAAAFVRYTANPSDHNGFYDADVVAIREDGGAILTNGGTIREDAQQQLWVLTVNGLHRLDRATGQFMHEKTDRKDESKLTGSQTALAFDAAGYIWISNVVDGIDRFDPRDRSVKHFRSSLEDPQSLSNNYVTSLLVDSTGTLWAGTTGGLDRFDANTQTFRHYRTRDGLPNDFIYAILEDDQGLIWVSTNKGLSRFNAKTGVFKNFDVQDGLQSNEFNSNAACKGPDGELFFGGINGVSAFDPLTIRDNPYMPPVRLTSLTQHGENVAVDPSQAQSISVHWPNNYFDFEFAALDYTRPQSNRYAYILEGFDRTWNEIGTRRSGRYTNLPGGVYTLRLKGSNSDGLWNETGASIRVQVIPPVWSTWWFRSLALALAAGAVFGGVRLRVRGVEARNQDLERLVRARTAEMERLYEQAKELAVVEERNRLARDLHDSAKQKAFAALAQLGAANGLVLGDPNRAQRSLREAETLVYEVIEELTFLIQEMYPAALKEKGLPSVLRGYVYEWEGRSDINADLQLLNERALPLQIEQSLYRVIQEALANVARHSQARRVSVSLTYLPDQVCLLVADDGQGFDLSQRLAGIGLRSMQERIAMIGGTLTIQSAPGKGTRVSACAPVALVAENQAAPAL